VKSQHWEYFCVLDFEATCEENKRISPQEIIEWPTVLVNARTMEAEAEFHTYVKPTHNPTLSQFCTDLTGIQQEWVDNGKDVTTVVKEYEAWLIEKALLDPVAHTKQFTFVTCGDWDLKTMLPNQLQLINKTPSWYFGEWINLKKAYGRFYECRVGGMAQMLKSLEIPLTGRHHSGIDDCRNISKVLMRMLSDGCVLENTWHA